MVTHQRNVCSVSHVLTKQTKSARTRQFKMTTFLFHEMVSRTECGWDRVFIPFFNDNIREKKLEKLLRNTEPVNYKDWKFIEDDEWDA